MMVDITNCIGDSCGWIAAFISMFSAGTYGVPIKETLYSIADLNPFIFQTYKTVIFFIVAVVTVLFLHVPIRITLFYGTFSGLLWVMGGTGGIVAVRLAGLATAVGTWASVMICVNFFWGILVFQEPVNNMESTIAAFALLTLGLVGMSFYGEPTSAPPRVAPSPPKHVSFLPTTITESLLDNDFGIVKNDADDSTEELDDSQTTNLLKQRRFGAKIDEEETVSTDTDSTATSTSIGASAVQRTSSYNSETHIRLCGNVIVRKRVAGIVCALFNGFMSGSSLIPMHFARRSGSWGGVNYLMSFSTGGMLSLFSIWGIYYVVVLINVCRQKAAAGVPDSTVTSHSCMYYFKEAASKMPSLHWSQLWKPGLASGLLNAAAMVGSVLAVTYLGQGVGNSVIQCKIIVRYVVEFDLSTKVGLQKNDT
jgi:hypothetical protein